MNRWCVNTSSRSLLWFRPCSERGSIVLLLSDEWAAGGQSDQCSSCRMWPRPGVDATINLKHQIFNRSSVTLVTHWSRDTMTNTHYHLSVCVRACVCVRVSTNAAPVWTSFPAPTLQKVWFKAPHIEYSSRGVNYWSQSIFANQSS